MPGKCNTRCCHPPLHSLHLALLLCETKVVATRRDGLDDLAAESLIAFILGKIKFCRNNSQHTALMEGAGLGWGKVGQDSRLKQVCELGNLSLLP